MAFKMKGFEPHNMYKTEKANTKADHDRLKKQGYDHSPYNKKSALTKSYKRNDGLNKSASFSHKSFDDMNWRERRIVRKEERKRGANNKQYSDTSGPGLGQRIRNFFN